MPSALREVESWHRRSNTLVRFGDVSYPIVSTVPLVSTAASYQTLPATVSNNTAPLPYPTYTDYPVRDWVDIDPAYPFRNLDTWAGLPDMSVILRSLTSRCYVKLPAGFRGKLVDFKSGGTPYALYAPNCMGLWGLGPKPGGAVIWMEPNTSTVASLIPVQSGGTTTTGNGVDGKSNPYTMIRLGPMNQQPTNPVSAAVHNYGFAVCGTDQPLNSNGEPHMYSGLLAYMGSGSTDEWITVCGVPGDWNSPPGETFQYAMYRTKETSWARFIEVDGFNVPGVSQGGPPTDFNGTAGGRQVGSAVGNNGALNIVFEDLYCHDSYVGGPTVSGAGGPDGTVCVSPTFIRMRSHRNANHGPHTGQNSGGKLFGGFNVEGTLGTLTLDHPDFRMSNETIYQKEHLSLANMLGDLQVIVIEPRWDSPLFGNTSGYVPATNGCFIFKIPDDYPRAGLVNSQKSTPIVTVLGKQLTVVHRYAGQGWPSGLDPSKHMIYVH